MEDDGASGRSMGEERALRHACRSAILRGMLPSTFRRSLVSTECEADSYQRVAYKIERRDVLLRLAPAPGARAQDLEPLPDPAEADPWDVEIEQLAAVSNRTCTCPTCAGAKKVLCPTCAGEARVRCHECRGRGQVAGQRGPKNCPTCRGRSTVKCTVCRAGKVTCPSCDGVGRVRAWLEMIASHRTQVAASPKSGSAALHKQLEAIEDFDREPGGYRIPLSHDSGWLDVSAERPAAMLEATLQPVLAGAHERVIAQRSQTFESPVFCFTYGTRVSRGVVHVSGDPPGLLPASRWRPLWLRTVLATGVGLLLLVAASLVVGKYTGRAEWFRDHGSGGAMGLFGFLAALTGGVLVAESWLSESARRVRRMQVLAGVTCASWLLLGALWFTGEATLPDVEQALERGELTEARLGIEAMEALGDSSSAALQPARARLSELEARVEQERQAVADGEHLRQVEAAASLGQAVGRLRTPWFSQDSRAQAVATIVAQAHEQIERDRGARDWRTLEQHAVLLSDIDQPLATWAHSSSQMLHMQECAETRDFSCAAAEWKDWRSATDRPQALQEEFDRTRDQAVSAWRDHLRTVSFADDDLEQRRRAIEQTIADSTLYQDMTGEKPPVSVAKLQESLRQTEKKLDAQRKREAEAERRRVAAEERAVRRAAEAEAREARKAAAAERRRMRDSAPLECNDGTLSPTCMCDRSSYRGCCSRHGGVAGCSE